MIAAVFASLALALTLHANAGISSQKALLSPHVHAAQALTWFMTAATFPNQSDCHGSFCDTESYGLLIASSVASTSKAGLLLTTRVRMFAPHQPVGGTVQFPSILVRSGHILAPDGTPFKREPLCRLYSRDLWGSPPAVIRVGTAWRFNRPSGYAYNLFHGVVKVKAVNNKTGDVSLHVNAGGAHTIDLLVSAGGIVTSETERWTIPTETEVGVFSLQYRSLARLWNIPQPIEPDIFNPNGRLIDVIRSPLMPSIFVVRVWHFGPYFFTPPALPKGSDSLLFLGVTLLVVLISRTSFMVVSRGGALALLRVGRRRLLLEIMLGVAIATACMWWVYR